MKSRPFFAPSLMCMDLLNVQEQIKILNNVSDFYHVDIMDGHFCKNISLSPKFVKEINKISEIPIDVHLMLDNPNDFIDELIYYGADIISLHIESVEKDLFRIMQKIKDNNKKIGLVLCPSTPIDRIKYILDYIDLLTIMTVDVGYIGQPFIFKMLEKIKEVNTLRKKHKYNFLIQCDGGSKKETYNDLYKAGIDCFVQGHSALFSKHTDLTIAYEIMLKEFYEATNLKKY